MPLNELRGATGLLNALIKNNRFQFYKKQMLRIRQLVLNSPMMRNEFIIKH